MDLGDVVQLDSCVRLIPSVKKPRDQCSVTIAVPAQSIQLISHVVIVSEVRQTALLLLELPYGLWGPRTIRFYRKSINNLFLKLMNAVLIKITFLVFDRLM